MELFIACAFLAQVFLLLFTMSERKPGRIIRQKKEENDACKC